MRRYGPGDALIYGVSSVDEGIEVPTRVEAGDLHSDGGYPEDTVHHRVERRLGELTRKSWEFARALGKTDGEGEDDPED